MSSGIITTSAEQQLALLNQKVDVLVREFNSVIDEVQVLNAAMAKTMSAGFKVQAAEITELNRKFEVVAKHLGILNEGSEDASPPSE